jgi:adenine-specific DNA-methyltransferase
MRDPAKHLGQYFTPRYVAEFMLDLSSKDSNSTVLEPACGQGIFLKILEERGYKNAIGYEIDKLLESITNVPIRYRSFIREKDTQKYDLVIGNPPYIRWKNLDIGLKNELKNDDLWNKYFNSLSDYLGIFIVKSIEALKDGGELIFITPEYWMNTQHAQSLRDYVIENGYFTDIIHFNETPIFDNVASSIVIFKFVKGHDKVLFGRKIKITKYLSRKRLSAKDLKAIKKGVFNSNTRVFEKQQFRKGEGWILAPNEVEKKLTEYENKCVVSIKPSLFGGISNYTTLGDIADIGNGLVSGLDKAFRLPEDIELTELELDSTLPVLKAKKISQYFHDPINRYIFLNNKVKSELELSRDFPNFYKILTTYKESLDKRYSYNRYIPYWEWVFLRSFNLFKKDQPRIFVPCKERISHKSFFRFSYVDGGIYPTQDVTAIFPKPGVRENIFYLLALLNSRYVFDWLSHKGVIKGNIVEFSERPLASLPVRLIDWSNPTEIKLHDEISKNSQTYTESRDQNLLNNIDLALPVLF